MATRDRQRTLWVGVIGHRPVGLEGADLPALRERLREALRQVAAVAPSVTVVSSLAEGSDRLGAHEALAAGLTLYAPLPFARDLYAEDFEAAESLAEYWELLGCADRVLELPGARATSEAREEAYGALSAALLLMVDVLIAIWDRQPARGLGGTGNTVLAAMRLGIPVIWIGSKPPHEIGLLTGGEGEGGGRDATLGVEPLTRLSERLAARPMREQVL